MKQTFKFAALAALSILAACNREAVVNVNENKQEEVSTTKAAQLKITILGDAPTKASDTATQGGENYMNDVEVFVFDANSSSISYGFLEAYKKVSGSEISNGTSATVTLNTTTGQKNVYVVANAGTNSNASPAGDLASTITKESQLLSAISEFSDNGAKDFIMVGSATKELAAGNASANTLDVKVKRLVARVKIGTVKGDFTSPALRQSKFVVKKIYLVNVPKQVKYVNGDATDVFGSGDKALSSGYPSIFTPASSGMKYYVYDAPAESDAANGFYNWMNPDTFNASTQTMTLSDNSAVQALTVKTYSESEGKLFAESGASVNALSDNTLKANVYFYCYPNSSEANTGSENMTEADFTTKLVIETELTLEGKTSTFYYPISIPYIQPNYAYTVNSLTIKRLGSTDPFHPVSTAECTFKVTVQDWYSGDIVGEYNGETSDDSFEI